jgi:hypothetical protein
MNTFSSDNAVEMYGCSRELSTYLANQEIGLVGRNYSFTESQAFI